ncbi:MAG: peptidylprolyl isomerase [Chloroflexota bacterium]
MGRKSRAKAIPGHHDQIKHHHKSGISRRTMMTIAAIAGVVVLVAAVAYFGFIRPEAARRAAEQAAALGTPDRVRLQTSQGEVVLEVYPKAMPVTVANFEKLVQAKFYDGLKWHRVESWVAQTGDPTATGTGGSEETIKLETTPYLSNVRGAIGMARRSDDVNSASSQFYIVKADATSLDGDYAVFGRVVEGMDVVDKLTVNDTIVHAMMDPVSSK